VLVTATCSPPTSAQQRQTQVRKLDACDLSALPTCALGGPVCWCCDLLAPDFLHSSSQTRGAQARRLAQQPVNPPHDMHALEGWMSVAAYSSL
jgi:hypothetical protein